MNFGLSFITQTFRYLYHPKADYTWKSDWHSQGLVMQNALFISNESRNTKKSHKSYVQFSFQSHTNKFTNRVFFQFRTEVLVSLKISWQILKFYFFSIKYTQSRKLSNTTNFQQMHKRKWSWRQGKCCKWNWIHLKSVSKHSIPNLHKLEFAKFQNCIMSQFCITVKMHKEVLQFLPYKFQKKSFINLNPVYRNPHFIPHKVLKDQS